MTLIEKIKLIERVDALIRRKATGSPKELACRINKSERYVFKLINLMKEMGAPIYYCSNRNSYCYDCEVEFSIGFVPRYEGNDIRGGKSFLEISSLHDICSQSSYIYS